MHPDHLHVDRDSEVYSWLIFIYCISCTMVWNTMLYRSIQIKFFIPLTYQHSTNIDTMTHHKRLGLGVTWGLVWVHATMRGLPNALRTRLMSWLHEPYFFFIFIYFFIFIFLYHWFFIPLLNFYYFLLLIPSLSFFIIIFIIPFFLI